MSMKKQATEFSRLFAFYFLKPVEYLVMCLEKTNRILCFVFELAAFLVFFAAAAGTGIVVADFI